MSKQDVIAALRSQMEQIGSTTSTATSELYEPVAISERTPRPEKYEPSFQDDEDATTPTVDESSKALKKIVALVNASDKSEKTIRERLMRNGFDEVSAETAIQRAKEYGFIDDMRFAEILVRSRLAQRKGSAGIERELMENGIDPSDVAGWPYEFNLSSEEETDRALDLLRRKPPRAKNKRDAAYRKLMQNGYPSNVASSAARMWSESIS